jgi:hypothetical protein
MSVVASPSGGLVACRGGRWKLNNGHEAVRALSYKAVKAARRFSALNLYNAKEVREILKNRGHKLCWGKPTQSAAAAIWLRSVCKALRAVHKIKEFYFDREM